MSKYFEAVANGGKLIHIKPEGVYKALCGFCPGSPKGVHFYRGRWKQLKEGVDLDSQPQEVRCRRCRTRYLRQTGQFRKLVCE